MRRSGTLGILAAVSFALLAGCGSDDGATGDEVTTAEAETRLTEWTGQLPEALADRDVLTPWKVEQEVAVDETASCPDGEAQLRYAASVEVVDTSVRDEDDDEAQATRVTGQLLGYGWDTPPPEEGVEPVVQRATREDDDPTGTELAIEITPVPRGWHYDITAHTACLPTS